jgi:hypothetical protein
MAGYPLWTMSVECCISKKETRQPSHQSVVNPLIRVSEATWTPPEAKRHKDFRGIESQLPENSGFGTSQTPLRTLEPG